MTDAQILWGSLVSKYSCTGRQCPECREYVGLDRGTSCPNILFSQMDSQKQLDIVDRFIKRVAYRLKSDTSDVNISVEDLANIIAEEL